MNSSEFISSTCRICLQDGATYPIFDESTTEASIHIQINKCFMEKIEDLEGYPRSICSSCKITLDLLCEFIDKYKKSSEILRESLVKVKTEVDDSYIDNNDFTWDDQEYVVIKIEKENDCTNSNEIIEKLKPLPDLKITKVDSKKCLKMKESKTIRETKNNRKALSIIKGEFDCNGDEWWELTKTSNLEKNSPEKKVKKSITKLVEIIEKTEKTENISRNSVVCEYCAAVFDRKYKLRNHINHNHMKTIVTCTICSKTYPSDVCLKLHKKRCHTKKTLQCEHCPKMFTTRDLLNGHIKRVHNKPLFPKVYSCKFCDKTYKGYYCAIAHERANHTGLRPAVCKVCGKAFYHDIYLREHMRIHTGELPFKCPFCDRGCTIRGNLKSHLRIHKKSELNSTIMSKMKPGYFKYLKDC